MGHKHIEQQNPEEMLLRVIRVAEILAGVQDDPRPASTVIDVKPVQPQMSAGTPKHKSDNLL